MLVENYKVGDTVKILTTQRNGQIIGYENGRWRVKLDEGNVVLCEDREMERRQILYG